MKFSLFAHIERVDPAQGQHALYEEFIALCQLSDKNGFAAIWAGDRKREARDRDSRGAILASEQARGRGHNDGFDHRW